MRSNCYFLISLVTFSAVVTACGATPDPTPEGTNQRTGQHADEIIGGSPATAFPEAALVNLKVNGQLQAACSGAVIAPNVVLTAGHCVRHFDGWAVTTPFAGGQSASATSSAVLDWADDSQSVNPNMHDLGLVFLSTPITLSAYPTIAVGPVPNNSQAVNVGRINNGAFSNSSLFVSKPVTVQSAASVGFPFDYVAVDVIEHGDSGGPVFAVGTHTIIAVNSGGGSSEVLARTDLVSAWIQQQIATHGGPGAGGGGTSTSASSGGSTSSSGSGAGAGAGGGSAGSGSASSSAASGGGGSCNGISYAGECAGNTVVWCEGGKLHHLKCVSGKQTCGFNAGQSYYDCL